MTSTQPTPKRKFNNTKSTKIPIHIGRKNVQKNIET